MNIRDLTDQAWLRYQLELQRLATFSGGQLDLLELHDAGARSREWRGIWVACERELVRVGQ